MVASESVSVLLDHRDGNDLNFVVIKNGPSIFAFILDNPPTLASIIHNFRLFIIIVACLTIEFFLIIVNALTIVFGNKAAMFLNHIGRNSVVSLKKICCLRRQDDGGCAEQYYKFVPEVTWQCPWLIEYCPKCYSGDWLTPEYCCKFDPISWRYEHAHIDRALNLH